MRIQYVPNSLEYKKTRKRKIKRETKKNQTVIKTRTRWWTHNTTSKDSLLEFNFVEFHFSSPPQPALHRQPLRAEEWNWKILTRADFQHVNSISTKYICEFFSFSLLLISFLLFLFFVFHSCGFWERVHKYKFFYEILSSTSSFQEQNVE